MMIEQIISFLSRATSNAIGMGAYMFDQTGTWGIVFAGISIVLISRFILGPILGFTGSGASDMVKNRRRSKE